METANHAANHKQTTFDERWFWKCASDQVKIMVLLECERFKAISVAYVHKIFEIAVAENTGKLN